jgi:hypothetical protein
LVFHPTQVLYADHSDLLAEHLPAKQFLVRSFHETGELPLWCPHEFAGMPFVHDIQVGMFYPPNWVLLLLPTDAVGAGMSWLVAGHVFLAGAFMLLYARSQGLRPYGSFVASIGYMFAGKWMLHLLAAGHLITVGLAWLPLVLWLMERAIVRGSLFYATWAGVAFALVVLGTHPQWTLYAGVFVAVWTLRTAWEVGTSRRQGLVRWLGCGAWTVLLAVGLVAVQLLPTLEAAGYSNRAAGVPASDVLSGGLRGLLFLVGPALTADPFNVVWEDRGGLGIVWLFLAVSAPLLGGSRVRFQAWVCLGLVLFALGGALLFQPLPGFRLFRQPTRMLLVAALPVALLAGSAVDALFALPGPTQVQRSRLRRLWLRMMIAAGILIVGFALRSHFDGKGLLFHWYWVTLLLTVPAAFSLLATAGEPRTNAFVGCLVLLLDAWGLALPLVKVRALDEIFPESACVSYLASRSSEHGRVMDMDWDAEERKQETPLGAGAPAAMLKGLEPLRGYNPLDVRRYKEFLQFIADRDDPLVPMENAFTFPVINSFPIQNKNLLNLLSVRYLLQPSDLPIDIKAWNKVQQDAGPRSYNFIEGGVRPLPGFTLYENPHAFPRAYVVSEAAPLPQRAEVLAALKSNDFRQNVFLEDYSAPSADGAASHAFRAATIREYTPNRIVIELPPGPAGYLVLADVWYPGWNCSVEGQPVTIHRANFLFRGIAVPQGAREAVFTFAPESYRLGRWVSVAALIIVVVISTTAVIKRRLFGRG